MYVCVYVTAVKSFTACNSILVDCTTIGGKTKDKGCVFPFKFNGETFNGCTEDEDGLWWVVGRIKIVFG